VEPLPHRDGRREGDRLPERPARRELDHDGELLGARLREARRPDLPDRPDRAAEHHNSPLWFKNVFVRELPSAVQ
jgi:hypothetical protein